MNNTMKWIYAHGYSVKIIGDIVYWQTNYQTAEYNVKTKELKWHDHDYFYTINSKYQQKTLEEVTYEDKFHCHKCGEWALISYDRCKEIVDENGEDRIIVYCPYCGTKHRIHL